MTGCRFGKLIVIEQVDDYIRKNGRRDAQWKCLCDCGNYTNAIGASLKIGDKKSCGCLRAREAHNIYEFYENYGICYTHDMKYKWLFDLDDYDKIKNIYWGAITGRGMNSQHYAAGQDKAKKKTVLMSRIIMGLDIADKRQVDHINHDVSDNRKNNLRICSTYENCVNKGRFSNNTSGATGVDWYKKKQKWRVRIFDHGKEHTIGYYDYINDAISVRKNAEKEFWGEFAYDNNINSERQVSNDIL